METPPGTLREERAVTTVLAFLRKTKAGEVVSLAALGWGGKAENLARAGGEEQVGPVLRMKFPFVPCIYPLRYANVSISTFPGNVHNITKERCKMECT